MSSNGTMHIITYKSNIEANKMFSRLTTVLKGKNSKQKTNKKVPPNINFPNVAGEPNYLFVMA